MFLKINMHFILKEEKSNERNRKTTGLHRHGVHIGSADDGSGHRHAEGIEIPYTVRVLSAHRTPNETLKLAEEARENGIQVFIAGAGGAAHLAGVIASSTPLPVIGVPMQTSALGGLDSLLSIVQMPGGIPVATTAIGKAGAKNAAILAAQMIGLADPAVMKKVEDFKQAQAEKVLANSYLDL